MNEILGLSNMKMSKTNKKDLQKDLHETNNREKVLSELKLCCNYLERNIKNDVHFKPEYEISYKINSMLESKQDLSETDVDRIEKMIRDIDMIEHYNGSGWLDYKIRLSHFLRLSGFDRNLLK